MGWVSPRKDAEQAKKLGEYMAGEYEKYHGRRLTAAELREVHAEASEAFRKHGARARRQAVEDQGKGRRR